MSKEQHMYPYWSKVITVVASERTLLDQDEIKVSQDSIDRDEEYYNRDRTFKTCLACGKNDIPMNKMSCVPQKPEANKTNLLWCN